LDIDEKKQLCRVKMKLIAKNIDIGYGSDNIILKEINFTIENGLTGVIGANGIGKSTLLKTISGLLPLINGEIFIDENKLLPCYDNNLSKLISVVLTEKVEVPFLDVYSLVLSGRCPHTGISGKILEKDAEIIHKYIKLCGIEHLQNRFVNQISDGERQRTLIARALVQETPLVVLDEPTSFLDYKARYEIMELLQNISTTENKLFIFSSHDLELVFQMTDYCMVISENREFTSDNTKNIIQQGIPDQLLYGSKLKFDSSTGKIIHHPE
jgi:iron complex transport system ATP-binding protein